MSEFTTEFVGGVLESMFRRAETIRAAGGIAVRDVVDRTATVPEGWLFDWQTEYYYPPSLILDEESTVN